VRARDCKLQLCVGIGLRLLFLLLFGLSLREKTVTSERDSLTHRNHMARFKRSRSWRNHHVLSVNFLNYHRSRLLMPSGFLLLLLWLFALVVSKHNKKKRREKPSASNVTLTSARRCFCLVMALVHACVTRCSRLLRRFIHESRDQQDSHR
jgi:hypothetical protein